MILRAKQLEPNLFAVWVANPPTLDKSSLIPRQIRLHVAGRVQVFDSLGNGGRLFMVKCRMTSFNSGIACGVTLNCRNPMPISNGINKGSETHLPEIDAEI